MIDNKEYLNSFSKGTSKELSLDAMKYFIKAYNNFEKDMKFIHISGTNGKGSCSEMINNILINAGYKVGKFISPHLIEYNERISINGKNISDVEMSNLIQELQPKIDMYNKINTKKITLFELETIMALLYFYRNKVDFVVLEVGLGGMYDATNIITKPLVSIITSIGYDHMHILGNTLPQIAYQKAGIIKENSNTVFFKQSEEINNIFINICNDRNNKLHLISKDDIKNYKYDNDYQYFDYKDLKQIKVNLKGIKQISNAAICIESMNILNNLGYKVSKKAIYDGLQSVIHKARFEVLNNSPLIIFDGAHNEPAIQNLKNSIDMYYKDFKRVYIISILKTKDYEKIIELLLKDKSAIFIFTSGNNDNKYTSGEELYRTSMKYKNEQKIYVKTLAEAIEFAMNSKGDGDIVNFVIGSFYVYGDVIKEILKYR